MKEEIVYHIPVLLHETIDGLNMQPDGTYVDVTFGGGGHSKEILRRLGEQGHLYSFDQDRDAMRNCPQDERFTFVYSNFRHLHHWLRYYDAEPVDGILADLGVSSHHFDDESRGFSFRFEGPLDMRMNTTADMTAADLCNKYSEEDIARILYIYGELRNSRRLASAIVKRRQSEPFVTVKDLIDTVEPLLNKQRVKKDMARVFQALRIEVNAEMQALEEMLAAAVKSLRPGGRLSVLTYHSLEDRMVKNFMRSGKVDGKVETDFFGRRLSPMRPINNKVILPTEEEMEKNPRSRSAKLRVAEKVELPKV